MTPTLYMSEVLSNWLVPLESNLQSENARCRLNSVDVSIFQPLKIKPQKVRRKKKKNKITRVPEIYKRPSEVFKERLIILNLFANQQPIIRTRHVRQRTEIFALAWGFSATLRGWNLWNFINNFALTQAPQAWNYRDLKYAPKFSRQIALRYTKLQPFDFTQELPLSFRRAFNINVVFQFKNANFLNPCIVSGLQFPLLNYMEEELDDMEIITDK